MAGWAAAIQAAISLYGQNQMKAQIQDGQKTISGMAEFNPQQVQGPMGHFFQPGNTTMQAEETAGSAANRGVLGAMNPNLLGGGMFNMNNFQNAFQSGTADMNPAFQNAQQGLGQQMGQSAFGNLGQMHQGMLGMASNAFGQAGNQDALIQQQLAASNALAAPGENDLINRTQNRLFSQGRLGSTGGSQEFGNTIGSIQQQRNQRVLGAQGLGLQQQGQLQNFGLGAMQQAGQFEGQGFGQMLGSLQQNQSAGQQRLQNANNMFGLGRDTFGQQFGLGLQGQQGQLNQDNFLMQSILGLMNSENGRIGATGMHASALGNLFGGGAAATGGAMGGLANSIGSMDFGGG